MRNQGQGLIFTLGVLTCVWFPFQDLALAFLYGRGAPHAAVKGALLLKEGLVALMLLGAALRWTLGGRIRPAPSDLWALAYGVLISVYLPLGEAELEPRLAQYRALALPVLLYLAGRSLPTEERTVERWIRWTLGLGLVLAATGLVERFALDVEFWRSAVPLGRYLEEVKSQREHLVEGLPGNLFGDYGFGFFQFRRLAGALGSPLTLGYYLVFPMVLAICLLLSPSGAKRAVSGRMLLGGLALGSLALVLTVTRAGVGAVLIAVALALFVYRRVRLLLIAALFGAGILVLFQDSVIRIAEATWTMNDASMRAHVLFLRSSLDVVLEYPAGLGVGAAGGWAHAMSRRFSGAAENAFLVIVAQASVYAGLLFLAFVLASLCRVLGASRRGATGLRPAYFWAVGLSALGYLATGLLSEQILTFTSVGHFWMSLGHATTLAGEPQTDGGEDAAP
jgi:hypothetical protein